MYVNLSVSIKYLPRLNIIKRYENISNKKTLRLVWNRSELTDDYQTRDSYELVPKHLKTQKKNIEINLKIPIRSQF